MDTVLLLGIKCQLRRQQETVKKTQISKPIVEADESPSVDSIKASDGKTYRFLGSQWAELLPSGKTGLFARKKISRELDEVTGRKERKIARKRKKKLEELDPSSGGLDGEKQLPDIHIPKQGLGFLWLHFSINNNWIFCCRSIKNLRK